MAKDQNLRRRQPADASSDKVSATLHVSSDKNSAHVNAPGTAFDQTKISANKSKPLGSRRRLYFIIGGLFGALAALGAWLAISQPEGTFADFETQFGSLSLEKLSLPDFGEFSDLSQMWSNFTKRSWMETTDFTIGREAYESGLRKQHAVVLVPGIVSTGLESWSTDPETQNLFRARLWGTATMVKAILKDKESWIKAMSLDPDTGLDPQGARVRAAQGFDAASYFITGYFIWAKVIENLAALGYDQSDMFLAAYDWRLSYYNLQTRDHYYSRLQYLIEHSLAVNGKKTVLVAHSMGSQVVLYFLKWVEHTTGQDDWVERHIESFVNIGGTLLGVPKASAALLSGEMRDTAELPAAAVYLLDKFFSRQERAELFRSWAGAASMWLKGGSDVWGDATGAPDDPENATITGGHMYYFKQPSQTSELSAQNVHPNLTMDGAYEWLIENSSPSFGKMMETNYSMGFEKDPKKIAENDHDHRKWANPLEHRLPNAPSMSIYCLYGYGKTTERAYFYKLGGYEYDEDQSVEFQNGTCPTCPPMEANNSTSRRTPLDLPMSRHAHIDTSIDLEDHVPSVRSGVINGIGDGTVSLLSLGTMCVEGWNRPLYNPAGIKVVTHEIKHRPAARDLRGGTTTGDHVDILGNSMLNSAILRVAAGVEDAVEEKIISNIREIAKKVKWT